MPPLRPISSAGMNDPGDMRKGRKSEPITPKAKSIPRLYVFFPDDLEFDPSTRQDTKRANRRHTRKPNALLAQISAQGLHPSPSIQLKDCYLLPRKKVRTNPSAKEGNGADYSTLSPESPRPPRHFGCAAPPGQPTWAQSVAAYPGHRPSGSDIESASGKLQELGTSESGSASARRRDGGIRPDCSECIVRVRERKGRAPTHMVTSSSTPLQLCSFGGAREGKAREGLELNRTLLFLHHHEEKKEF
ncbi:hypothetical protein BC826DRAFT_967693 [Russula brevipes]|nr:hypothetical protein BC826DRAFT_967693 [Russula brevipes]